MRVLSMINHDGFPNIGYTQDLDRYSFQKILLKFTSGGHYVIHYLFFFINSG